LKCNSKEAKFYRKIKKKNKKFTYPIAAIGDDIEIHFMHYKTNQEVIEKWGRRPSKIVRSDKRLFFLN
jgi:uncharacterized protein (DUF1919 family)